MVLIPEVSLSFGKLLELLKGLLRSIYQPNGFNAYELYHQEK